MPKVKPPTDIPVLPWSIISQVRQNVQSKVTGVTPKDIEVRPDYYSPYAVVPNVKNMATVAAEETYRRAARSYVLSHGNPV